MRGWMAGLALSCALLAGLCGNAAAGNDPVADNGGPPARGMGTIVVVLGDDLYSVRADGTDEQQLTHEANGSFANNPAYSPDGSLIAYTRAR